MLYKKPSIRHLKTNKTSRIKESVFDIKNCLFQRFFKHSNNSYLNLKENIRM